MWSTFTFRQIDVLHSLIYAFLRLNQFSRSHRLFYRHSQRKAEQINPKPRNCYNFIEITYIRGDMSHRKRFQIHLSILLNLQLHRYCDIENSNYTLSSLIELSFSVVSISIFQLCIEYHENIFNLRNKNMQCHIIISS